ncbi:MAG: hypothetical protein Q4C59_05165 [Lachnospiraceae bacterium]|nr:hypothetical protein [Lachnospiraceae bacterium]
MSQIGHILLIDCTVHNEAKAVEYSVMIHWGEEYDSSQAEE